MQTNNPLVELQSSNFPTVSIYLAQYITMNMEYSYKYENIVFLSFTYGKPRDVE